MASSSSVHAGDQLVDLVLAVAPDATLVEGVSLLLEALEGGGQLEGPQEVVGLLEVRAHSGDLVDQVLNAGDAVLAEGSIDDLVVGQRDARSVHLAVAALVDQVLDRGTGGVAVGDVGLNATDHVHRCAVHSHEHTVVQLTETEQLHDLLALGVKLVDTIKAKMSDFCHLVD